MTNEKRLMLVVGILVAVLSLASPAFAVVNPIPSLRASQGSNTEMQFTSVGPGQGVTGFIADASNSFDPVSGYPPVDPATGFTPLNEGFAGIIIGTPVG